MRSEDMAGRGPTSADMLARAGIAGSLDGVRKADRRPQWIENMSSTEGAVVRRLSELRWLILPLVPIALTGHAIPPPPPALPQLRAARMTATVRSVDADIAIAD